MFDDRLAEINQRALDNLAVCVDDDPQAWDVENLPGGKSEVFYFQCVERHSDVLTVYFGVHENKAYLIEHVAGTVANQGLANVPSDDDSAGDSLLMAIASMDGTDVRLWSARSKGYSRFCPEGEDCSEESDKDIEYTRSWVYLEADRTKKILKASFSGIPWPGSGATDAMSCGASLHAGEDSFSLGMMLAATFETRSWDHHAKICSIPEGTSQEWGFVAYDGSGCYDSENFESLDSENCEGLNDLGAFVDLRARYLDEHGEVSLSYQEDTAYHLMGEECGLAESDSFLVDIDGLNTDVPGGRGCYARAFELIYNPGFPEGIRDFLESNLPEGDEEP